MKINPALDPEIQQLIADTPDDLHPVNQMSAEQMRIEFKTSRAVPPDPSSIHQITQLDIPAEHGNIACRVYKPVDQDNLPVMVWFHGGGWVIGDLDTADYTCRHLSSVSGCIVLSVDYRLAPEQPFPAAFDDCFTALKWTAENAQSIGADKNRIAVGGDSAGGNLAACVCIAAQELKLKVKYQLLIYPVVEADFNNQSYKENSDDYLLTTNLMKWFWDKYVPDTELRDDARVNPLQGNLVGLPPAYVLTAGFDPLRDEGIKYANALKDAGVNVSFNQVDDTIHGFFAMPVAGGRKAREIAGIQLKGALL